LGDIAQWSPIEVECSVERGIRTLHFVVDQRRARSQALPDGGCECSIDLRRTDGLLSSELSIPRLGEVIQHLELCLEVEIPVCRTHAALVD
jgi:hypothetical protein